VSEHNYEVSFIDEAKETLDEITILTADSNNEIIIEVVDKYCADPSSDEYTVTFTVDSTVGIEPDLLV